MVAVAVGVATERIRESNRRELQKHYLRVILLGEDNSERYIENIASLRGKRAKQFLVEVITQLSPYIYRLDEEPLLRLDHSLHLSQYLLFSAEKSQGNRRARYLYWLSRLPSDLIYAEQLNKFSSDPNRMVRFFAMAAKVNVDKDNFPSYVSRYDSTLTPFELSHLISILRCDSVVVAYQPLLLSNNLNLNLLGLGITREFRINNADWYIYKLIEDNKSYMLQREALYTLAFLELDLCRGAILNFLRSMPHNELQRFLRFITTLGYSQESIDAIATKQDRNFYNALLNSYKIKIECSQSS